MKGKECDSLEAFEIYADVFPRASLLVLSLNKKQYSHLFVLAGIAKTPKLIFR